MQDGKDRAKSAREALDVADLQDAIAALRGLDQLTRWLDLVAERPAVQKGRSIPVVADLNDREEEVKKAASKLLA